MLNSWTKKILKWAFLKESIINNFQLKWLKICLNDPHQCTFKPRFVVRPQTIFLKTLPNDILPFNFDCGKSIHKITLHLAYEKKLNWAFLKDNLINIF